MTIAARPSYGAFRIGIILRILSEKLSPTQTADALEAGGYSEVGRGEILYYRRLGETWELFPKSPEKLPPHIEQELGEHWK